MTLREITVDNSVRYILKTEQTKEIEENEIKNKKQSEQLQPISGGGEPNTRKQNKIFSRNNEKFVKDFVAGGFGMLK